MVIKRVLCPQKVRRVPPRFSWIDQRLVREGHLMSCSHQALALYLLLLTVADAQGLSYYSEGSLCGLLKMGSETLQTARGQLCRNELIAYEAPLYQVLELGDRWEPPAPPREPRRGETVSIAEVLRQAMGGES